MGAPREIRVSKDRRTMMLAFDEDEPSALSAELLRVLSPSAEVQGHSPQQRVTVAGKMNVAIARIEPVGNYAIRIAFDDGHETGIYTWSYLRELCDNTAERFEAYLAELAGKGLSR